MLPSRPLPATYGNKSPESDPARVYEGELLEARGPGLHLEAARASGDTIVGAAPRSGGDCHRLTHGHNRGVTRPGMLSQSLRPYRKRLVSSRTALGLLTKTRIKNVGVYRPFITLRHPIRLLSTLGQTQLIKVPLKHGDDAGGPGRSHRILSFGYPPLLLVA